MLVIGPARSMVMPHNGRLCRGMRSYAASALSAETGFPEALLPAAFAAWSGAAHDLSKLILHRDKDIVVIYKPPGILTQPDWVPKAANGTTVAASSIAEESINIHSLLQQHLDSQSRYESPQAGLVHRIDRPCSGLLVFALNPMALSKLNKEFKDRVVQKVYLCVVNGNVNSEVVCEDYLLKSSTERTRVVKLPPGKVRKDVVLAKLTFRPLCTIDYDMKITPSSTASLKSHKKIQTLLEVDLETGRKHQIRAQLAHMQLPICGDKKYNAPQSFVTKDIALHAHRLGFHHPSTNQFLQFSCMPPRVWEKRFGSSTVQTIESLLKK